MLSIRAPTNSSSDSASPEPCTLNLLPCRIAHNGPCNAGPKHWNVETNEKSQQSAYFRGRKLVSTPLALPPTHTGAVLDITDDILASSSSDERRRRGFDEDEDEDEEEDAAELPVEIKAVDQLAQFDKIYVWGHEVMVDGAEDAVVKGVEEWVMLAGRMNSWEEPGEGSGKN